MLKKHPKFWLVAFPTFVYAENVKELAQAHGLTIIDEQQAGDYEREHAVEGPALTLRDEAGDEGEAPKRRGRPRKAEGSAE